MWFYILMLYGILHGYFLVSFNILKWQTYIITFINVPTLLSILILMWNWELTKVYIQCTTVDWKLAVSPLNLTSLTLPESLCLNSLVWISLVWILPSGPVTSWFTKTISCLRCDYWNTSEEKKCSILSQIITA